MSLICLACKDFLCPIASEIFDPSRFKAEIHDNVVVALSAYYTVGQINTWKQLDCQFASLMIKLDEHDHFRVANDGQEGRDKRKLRICVRKRFSTFIKTSLDRMEIECELDDPPRVIIWTHRLTVSVNSDDPLAKSILGRPNFGNLTMEPTIELACRLLNECNKHDSCQIVKTPLLPTRTIYVGDCDLEICLNAKPGQREQYLTLSYSWGLKKAVVTTKSNLMAHMNSIAAERLPATIRDAIHVTRSLGFRYIWVDAMCIVQDDENDVAVEMSKMASIYSNSTLTISAEDALDSSEGLLTRCDDDLRPEITTRLPFISASNVRGHLNLMYNSVIFSLGHIHSRSWTMQEHYLPRRILYLGYTLRWQCPEGLFESIRVLGCNHPALLRQSHLLEPKTDSDGKCDLNPIYNFWNETILTLALGRNLTKPTDSLPSLAGIASEFAIPLSDTYLAGIWKGKFSQGLLWHVTDPGTQMDSFSQRNSRAPTWSCLSLRRPISIDWFRGSGQRVSLIDYEIELFKKTALFGQVRGGRLTLQAPLVKVGGEDVWRLNFRQSAIYARYSTEPKEWYEISPDDGRLVALLNAVFDDYDHTQVDSPHHFWMAYLMYHDNFPGHSTIELYEDAGIVLLKRLDGCAFERIGHFRRHGKFKLSKLPPIQTFQIV